jgi:copper transport protein
MLRFTQLLLLLGVLYASLVAGAHPAAAHAAFVRSDPAAGAVLPQSPPEIRIWFAEPLEARFTRAQVLDAAGVPLAGVN